MLHIALRKRQGAFTLEVDFSASLPGVVALFGRSGSGKTTLVNLIAGLARPDEGRIELDGVVLCDTDRGLWVPVQARGVGYVFQDSRLFPHLRVLGNLRYGLTRVRGRPRVVELEEVVSLLGLAPLLTRRPHQLSGGERQRVALGRALLSQPRLLLLDEPLASLDVARREEILPYLQLLRDRLRIPMVYVSHQIEEVLQLATSMVLLEGGRSVVHGTPAEVSLHPEVRAVVGQDAVGAVLEGRVLAREVGETSGLTSIEVPGGVLQVALTNTPPGTRLRIQLLARDLILALQPPQGLSVRNALAGTVTELVNEDDTAVLVTVDLDGTPALARVTQEAATALHLRPGLALWVLVKAVGLPRHAFRTPV